MVMNAVCKQKKPETKLKVPKLCHSKFFSVLYEGIYVLWAVYFFFSSEYIERKEEKRYLFKHIISKW